MGGDRLAAAELGRAAGPDWLIYPTVIACFYGISMMPVLSMCMSDAPTVLPDDPAALKAMIVARAGRKMPGCRQPCGPMICWSSRRGKRIARLQKQKFGASSEKIEREIEQLELALEGLQVALAEAEEGPVDDGGEDADDPTPAVSDKARPRRRPRVSNDTPRERRELDPGETCPDCGGMARGWWAKT